MFENLNGSQKSIFELLKIAKSLQTNLDETMRAKYNKFVDNTENLYFKGYFIINFISVQDLSQQFLVHFLNEHQQNESLIQKFNF